MTRSNFVTMLLFALTATTLVGCAKAPVARPAPGDTVSVVLVGVDRWESGGLASFGVRLRAEGAADTKAQMLPTDVVPHELLPTGSISFYKGDELLTTIAELNFTPDC